MPSNGVISDFFPKKNSDLFSAIQDASFAILKSIFEKLLFLGSYKGRGKKKQNLHIADFTKKTPYCTCLCRIFDQSGFYSVYFQVSDSFHGRM